MDGFCAFILTHGRPHRQDTLNSLKRHGYTGRIIMLVDNEDATAPEYQELYGSMVQVFDKADIASRIDEGDNFNDRRAIIYARNACFEVAEKLGITHFVQLDDDYTDFRHKQDGRGEYINGGRITDLDAVFAAMIDFLLATPALSVAMSQGGDFPGGDVCTTRYKIKRKAMNSFFCSTERPFKFVGRINEDVNTYTSLAARGALFLTIPEIGLQQRLTQTNKGGMTHLYEDSGTYVKSFYSVMYHPSTTRVGFDITCRRIHHRVRWRYTAACILDESHRKRPPKAPGAAKSRRKREAAPE